MMTQADKQAVKLLYTVIMIRQSGKESSKKLYDDFRGFTVLT